MPASAVPSEGTGLMGQEYLALQEQVRRAVREEIRGEVHDAGCPVEVEVEVRIGSGRAPTG
jgi:hypothetical protein